MAKGRGFTLIEMMIVLAIVGGLAALAMPYLNNRNNKTKSFLRKLAVMSRELHTRAKLRGAVYRTVFDLGTADQRAAGNFVQHFWVERANGRAVMKANEEEAEKKWREDDRDGEAKDPRGFALDPSFVKEPSELPSGIEVDRIELTRVEEPITEGRVFIHYLPEGLVDEAAVHFKGQKGQAWTLSIHPLTGKGELLQKHLSLKEIRSQ